MKTLVVKSIHIFARGAVGTLLVAGLAVGAPIPVFNTGVDAAGAVLNHGTLGDPHYTLTVVPGGTSQIQVLTSAGGYPIGPWVADSTISRWIGPNNSADADGPAGTYEYRTFFSLAGLIPGTALLTGRWASDDGGTEIFLNGVATGNTSPSLSSFTAFSIGSGFIAGQNELVFRLNNGGGPTGLRVEISGTADLANGGAPIPEPASVLLTSAALAGLLMLRRRRA